MNPSTTVHPVQPLSNGRLDIAELTALAMTIVIGAGAFTWSFAALTELSVMAGITQRLAWAGPIFVDGAIVQSVVALVSLQRRARQGVSIPVATRWFFWGELFAAELVSVVGNGLHAAESGQRILPATIAACVAGAAPLFGLAATHGLTALIEVPRNPEPAEMPGWTPVYAEATRLDTDRPGVDNERAALDSDSTVTVEEIDTDSLAERDTEIVRRHIGGESMRKLAAVYGISPSRVGQIVTAAKQHPDAEDDRGEVLSLIR
ncbi:DUF2637 domain-containing protein [Nocardia altamirensis]|uniref:DUF2637 domain-containing protein n=1 Tax=Nocardia altamirensis TaxID=472158 RepID=UPI0008405539|nr:DUF2637 domain-containing protein [Nocardia altamirensis]